MAVLSLPLSFTNSFWSQDYRRGVEVLFEKLEQGVAENDEIIHFIRARANAEGQLAATLIIPGLTGPPGAGFGADDGASLLMAFRGLQAESAAQGQAHKNISKELDTLVADPFDEWAQGYKERLKQNRAIVVDNWLRSYEHAQGEVTKLKNQYLTKIRRADEAEDDAKFAPNGGPTDKYTNSPRLRPIDGRRTPPQRTASVSERIAMRLKEIQKKSSDALAQATSTQDPNQESETEDEPDRESAATLDKGKGKAIESQTLASPLPMSPLQPPKELPGSPAPMLLAGLSFTPVTVSQLLTRAAAEINLRPVRFPLLGEYKDCFNGEEFVAWLNENVDGFGGSLDRAEDAARDLTEREDLLRRIGEFGNQFDHSDDAFYQFRPKAFTLGGEAAETNAHLQPTNRALQPETLIKRTGTLVNLVSKALNANANGEPTYVKARHDAEEADRAYRIAIRKLDRQRLGLEERLEETLKVLQRWETERLRAVKTVLLQFQGTLANLPKSLEPSIERSATLIAAYQPESDLTALIERYRTGPFRPHSQVYESVAHDEPDVLFGIDLRKWAESGWDILSAGGESKGTVPPVITALLGAMEQAYGRLPDDMEKRKSWIYEVPLPAVHHLRETLNGLPLEQPIPSEVFAKYDAPVIASAVKLWVLELDPPLALYEGWDDFRKLYPTVGSSAGQAKDGEEKEQHLRDLGVALQKLPRVHLYVLDALIKHFKSLIDNTAVEEANEVYITKLALSVGRTIIRPKVESELSIQDRHPTLLFIDLVNNYGAIIPPTITRKKRESERKVPLRKRTAPIDMRLSRSRISVGADAQQLLVAQQAAQNPSLVKPTKTAESPRSPPPHILPSAPPSAAIPAEAPPPVPQPPILAPPPLPLETTSNFTPPPPPPPFVAPPPPPIIASPTAAPARPSFKEPPPEFDDQPPRPSFKEPPPEPEEISLPMPNFTNPPVEQEIPGVPYSAPAPSSPAVANVIPPTPRKRYSIGTTAQPRSPSPAEDQVLGTGRASISRSGSGQGANIRGPRMAARGARPPVGGNVSSLVSSLNRQSMSGSPPNVPISPRTGRIASPSGRPSSVLGRTAAFSRRTMASDAEDDIVDRK